MNIVEYLIGKFFQEEKMNIIILFVLSLAITLVQTNAISYITANIILSIESNKPAVSIQFFTYFMAISALFLIIYYGYKYLQNTIVTKLTQWLKHELLKVILLANNENMRSVNFVEFLRPITRIATSVYALFFDVGAVIVPMFAFLCMISCFFLYQNTLLGLGFIFGNLCVFSYIFLFWKKMKEKKRTHENQVNQNEKIIIDILNNIDKVIYRGQTSVEINQFSTLTDKCIEYGLSFLSNTTNHVMVMIIIVYITLFGCMYYLIKLQHSKKITPTIFITFFTILLLYRDKILNTLQNIPDYLEFLGRLEYIVDEFNRMLGENHDVQKIFDKSYETALLDFTHIRFRNVSFNYQNKESTPIFENKSMDVYTTNKIIGIVGLSGKGKSTFAKLLLRLYDPTEGTITIDGKDVSTIDPNYIRINITYVNQNSKLFDKKIIDNLVYGCNNPDACESYLKEIMQYATIRELYKNVDIINGPAGSLGENLSGGQRQVVNIISGLINPSKILILDEPTNALDAALKAEVIALIHHFRQYKQCIIIITHDKDVYSLFDEVITL